MPAAPLTYIGSPADDFYIQGVANEYDADIQTFQGDDTVGLSGDYVDSFIDLGEDADNLAIGDFGPGANLLEDSIILAGSGEDNIGLFLSSVSGNLIELEDGNDRILISSTPIFVAGFPVFAEYTFNTIRGGEGTDAVIVDNTVGVFSQNVIELGDNDNSSLGGFADVLIDGLLACQAFQDLIEQGPAVEYAYVAATEVAEITVRGGQGEDILFFESFSGSPSTLDGTDAPIARSLINGNGGDDIIGIARNFEQNTSVLGGRGNDNILLLSGTFFDSQANGNLGADVITVGAIDINRSTFFGGQGDDVMDIGAANIANSLLRGDLGADKINFAALVSTNTTLSGGDGNDEIDDFSYAIAGQGNLLEGGDGNDILRQAANITGTLPVAVFATFVGGKGTDIMTGDSNTQLLGPKQATTNPAPGAFATDVTGATSDMFRFAFGDANVSVVAARRDVITDFDSNASRYLRNGTFAFNNPFIDPVADFVGFAPGANPLTSQLRRDIIDLQKETAPGSGIFQDVSIKISNAGLLAGVSINSQGRVIGGVGSIQKFIDAGASLTTEGAAILWQETAAGVAPRSQLFISNGNGVLDDQDLLIQLNQVSGFAANVGGLVLTSGNITDITLA